MRDYWPFLVNLADLMTYHDAPDGPCVLHYTMFIVSKPSYVVYSIYDLYKLAPQLYWRTYSSQLQSHN